MLHTSRASGALTIAALAALALAHPAQAAKFVVSGDTNIGNPLDGTGGSSVDAGNQQFFKNVLDGGNNVVIENTSNQQTNADINSFYNGLGGVTSSIVSGTITSTTLAGANLFIDELPDAAFTGTELTALNTFENNGGTIFLMGEGINFDPAGSANINADLTALGSGLQILPAGLDPTFHHVLAGNIVPGPLTAGVNSFSYAYTSQVTGGTPAFLASDGQSAFVASEGFNGKSPSVPEPGSFALLGLGLIPLALVARRKRAN